MSRGTYRLFTHTYLSRCFRTVAALAAILLFVQPGQAQSLDLFKNYFVTGDFASKGVSLRGHGQLDTATGKYLAQATIAVDVCAPNGPITLTCVPPDADVLSAFLYWEVVEKTGAPTNAVAYIANNTGQNDSITNNHHAPLCDGARCVLVGKPLGTAVAPCWSSGGSTGASNGVAILRNYREDVYK